MARSLEGTPNDCEASKMEVMARISKFDSASLIFLKALLDPIDSASASAAAVRCSRVVIFSSSSSSSSSSYKCVPDWKTDLDLARSLVGPLQLSNQSGQTCIEEKGDGDQTDAARARRGEGASVICLSALRRDDRMRMARGRGRGLFSRLPRWEKEIPAILLSLPSEVMRGGTEGTNLRLRMVEA